MTSNANAAVMIVHYLKLALERSGVEISGDMRVELNAIIEAARETDAKLAKAAS